MMNEQKIAIQNFQTNLHPVTKIPEISFIFHFFCILKSHNCYFIIIPQKGSVGSMVHLNLEPLYGGLWVLATTDMVRK